MQDDVGRERKSARSAGAVPDEHCRQAAKGKNLFRGGIDGAAYVGGAAFLGGAWDVGGWMSREGGKEGSGSYDRPCGGTLSVIQARDSEEAVELAWISPEGSVYIFHREVAWTGRKEGDLRCSDASSLLRPSTAFHTSATDHRANCIGGGLVMYHVRDALVVQPCRCRHTAKEKLGGLTRGKGEQGVRQYFPPRSGIQGMLKPPMTPVPVPARKYRLVRVHTEYKYTYCTATPTRYVLRYVLSHTLHHAPPTVTPLTA